MKGRASDRITLVEVFELTAPFDCVAGFVR